MRRSVSSPEETLTRELRIRRAADKLQVFIWYYFSNKMILEGEINDAKMGSFSSDFQTLIKHLTFFIFFMNY